MIKLYNDDCFKIMKQLKEENVKVDAIICDPPYVINYADWDKEFNNKPWLKKSYELLNKGGSLLVFNDFKKATEIIKYAQSLGFVYKDTLIWKKTNPMPRNITRRYVQDMEFAIWAVKKNAKWTFNKLAVIF